MAKRRMFCRKIIESDPFSDMPLSAQALYFHICLAADDDGFVSGVKGIRRRIGASEDDLRILIAKRFLIPFSSGVVVVRHWRVHNSLRADRYTPTEYADEAALLMLKRSEPDKGCYYMRVTPLEGAPLDGAMPSGEIEACALNGNQSATGRQPDGALTDAETTLTGEIMTKPLNGNQTATTGIPLVALRYRYRDSNSSVDSTYNRNDTIIPRVGEKEEDNDSNRLSRARARVRARDDDADKGDGDTDAMRRTGAPRRSGAPRRAPTGAGRKGGSAEDAPPTAGDDDLIEAMRPDGPGELGDIEALAEMMAQPVVRRLYGRRAGALMGIFVSGDYPADLAGYAVMLTELRNRRSPLDKPYAYTLSLLDDWTAQGFKTREDVQEAREGVI